jgi:DNA repair exonuclease SbcCD nuclease subunit
MTNKPTAILTADIHLRSTFPRNRIDNYFEAQENKIKFLANLQSKYDIPIIDGGDLFHKWNSTPFLEAWAVLNLPNDIFTIPGNHELPSHNINYLEKSSLYVLKVAKKITLLSSVPKTSILPDISIIGCPYGSYDSFLITEGTLRKRNVLVIHDMIVDSPLKYKDRSAVIGHDLFKKFPMFDLIVSGHNHKPFVIERYNRLIVNPGSMMRMSKDQIEHKPRVYLWYAEENKVEPVYYPIEENVFAIEQIKKENKKEEQINSYIKALNENYELSLSFRKNMETHLKNNPTRKPVQDLIWESIHD